MRVRGDLRGILGSQYIAMSFDDQNLAYYYLSGVFVDVSFRGANLAGCVLNGTFVDADFRGATLTDAQFGPEQNFTGCTFDPGHGPAWWGYR